jgi:hypothetical protein
MRNEGSVSKVETEEAEWPSHDIKTKKVKINLSLCLIKHYVMKTYAGVEVWLS